MNGLRLRPGNPMNRAMYSVLGFEVIIFILAVPGMIVISHVATPVAFVWAAVGTVLAIAACAGLKKSWGYPLGWLAQLVAVLMGLATPMMYLAGGLFALLWVMTFVLGRRIEPAA